MDAFTKSIRDVQKYNLPESYTTLLPDGLQDILAAFQTIDVYQLQSGPAKRQWISGAIYEVEKLLLFLDDDGFARLFTHPRQYCSLPSLFQLASHVYLLLVLRQIFKQFPVVQTFAETLASKLRIYHLRQAFADRSSGETELLLWIQSLHCLSTVESKTRFEAQKALLSICKACGIFEFSQFSKALKQVAWVDGTLGDEVVDLWTTMMAAVKNSRNVSCLVLRKAASSEPTLYPAVYQREDDDNDGLLPV